MSHKICNGYQDQEDPWASDDNDGPSIHLNSTNATTRECFAGKDWEKTEIGVEKDGYRQGLSADEAGLQEGFNSAFRLASDMATAAGRLHGEICAMLHHQSVVSQPSLESNSECDASQRETQALEQIRDQVSALMSSIPVRLRSCQEICHNSSTDVTSEQSHCQCNCQHVNVVTKDGCMDSLSVEFLDELNKLKSSLNSIVES